MSLRGVGFVSIRFASIARLMRVTLGPLLGITRKALLKWAQKLPEALWLWALKLNYFMGKGML
jgi:hypothetical protein